MRLSLSVIWFVFLASCISCSGWKREADRAAEKYYTYLIEERYEDFVAGIACADSFPEFYRSQMVDVIRNYVYRERELHGGLMSVEAVDCKVKGNVANAFLELLFADSVKEEISVPMVYCDDEWKMQ